MARRDAGFGLAVALLLLGAGSFGHAAAPARKPADPYVTGVQDEVMLQNLTCDDIREFLIKGPTELVIGPATRIMNQPQHSRDTSDTLFGPTLTRLIITASVTPDGGMPPADHPPNRPPAASAAPPPFRSEGSSAPDIVVIQPVQRVCKLIVPMTSPPNADACDGSTQQTQAVPSSTALVNGIGELKLLALFERAARYKNCRG